jgi:hypothetical protein
MTMTPSRILVQYILPTTVAAAVFLPVFAAAQGTGLVPCTNDCEFNDLIELVQRVLNYLIYIVAAPIAAIMFAIAGYMYLTAGDDTGKVKKAHDIFISVLWGFGIMLIAWALVSFVLNLFTDGTTYSLLEGTATGQPQP